MYMESFLDRVTSVLLDWKGGGDGVSPSISFELACDHASLIPNQVWMKKTSDQ